MVQLAQDLGWSARVTDLPELGPDDIGERSLVVVATQGHGDEEALELANNTKYGLAAYIWTSDLKRAHNFSQSVEAGMVWLNSNNVRDLRTPFGGVKASGLGHEGGYRSIDFYTDQQVVHINLGEIHNPVFGKQEQAAAKIDG